MLKKPTNFKLEKLKILASGGIEVLWTVEEKEADSYFNEGYQKKSVKVPHPDLNEAMDKLKKYLAATHGMTAFNALAKRESLTAKEKSGFKSVEKLMAGLERGLLENLEVRGVSLSGDENNPGVIISGVNRQNGSGAALNSPRIKLNGDVWGWEPELDLVLDEIEDEVKQFLFNNKRAQLDMFGSEDDEESEGKKEKSGEFATAH